MTAKSYNRRKMNTAMNKKHVSRTLRDVMCEWLKTRRESKRISAIQKGACAFCLNGTQHPEGFACPQPFFRERGRRVYDFQAVDALVDFVDDTRTDTKGFIEYLMAESQETQQRVFQLFLHVYKAWSKKKTEDLNEQYLVNMSQMIMRALAGKLPKEKIRKEEDTVVDLGI